MFKSYIYKIAVRYFFSKDKKTIVNRINGFAFFMIVSAACVLLLVLSGFAGLKDFGLTYTSSFDPELKIVQKTGSYFVLSQDKLDMIKGIEGVLDASPVIEEKVALSNELNSGSNELVYVNPKSLRPATQRPSPVPKTVVKTPREKKILLKSFF